jgi:hypothetical protein
MNQPKWTPCFRSILRTERAGSQTVLWYAADDGKRYRIELDQNAVGQTIDTLQGTADVMTAGAVRTLTVVGLKAAATPDQKGILIRTQEWGTIALAMPQEALTALRAGLAQLELLPESKAKH